MKNKDQSRRKFLSDIALGTLGTLGGTTLMAGSSLAKSASSQQDTPLTRMVNQAPDGKALKAGLIGCGGRGTGAAVNFVDAGPNLEIVALGDIFPDQLNSCRANLKAARNIDIPDEKCFTGIDNFEKVIDAGIDVVLLASPPHFRPHHVKAAVDAGKHVFQEKPVAVDPYGARLMDETTQRAKQKNLCMVSGTMRRYAKDFVETKRRVANGAIGDIVSATIMRNGGSLWWVERQPGWSDMEYMIRNWANFNWLSGDHIVEQFVHEIDVMSWYLGSHPLTAIGYGGRHQRQSGDQFDHFSIFYEYKNGINSHCTARQISGCNNKRKQIITGTDGYADAAGSLYSHNGELIWEYPYPQENDPDQTWAMNNPFVQEHVELVTAIRTGSYLNDSDEQIKSTRIAIMGRMAAYTGQEVTWEEILNSDMQLGPDNYDFGPVDGFSEKPPVVGRPAPPVNRYV